MKIKRLELKNFRNYNNISVDFKDGLNVIVGNNAQGKTNLLEAIYFCAIGKSMRVSKEREVINWYEEKASINLVVEKAYSTNNISVYFSKKEKKTVKINKIPIKRIGELLGEFNAVYFDPNELKLVKECPEDRRRFMDIAISQTSKNYFYLLMKYEKILKNRNKLLKSSKDINVIKDTIEIWNEQLSNTAAALIMYRLNFLKKLEDYSKKAHSFLTDNKETLKISYVGIQKENVQLIKEEILNNLKKSLEKDFALGFSSCGPHRDDIKLMVNDIDIRLFGSQGQQRTVALSLKLSELEIIKNETGEMPILLLDDVFSELDENRRKKLIKFTEKTQTIITCTEFENKPINYKKYIVNNGHISF